MASNITATFIHCFVIIGRKSADSLITYIIALTENQISHKIYFTILKHLPHFTPIERTKRGHLQND